MKPHHVSATETYTQKFKTTHANNIFSQNK